ncbi:MAG: GNAT family N-acetyltransferase [Acidobacteriota bacterium]
MKLLDMLIPEERIEEIKPENRESVIKLIKEVSIFNQAEIKIAIELIDLSIKGNKDYITKVYKSKEEDIWGFICYGKNLLGEGVWELYWIAVNPSFQRKGIAKRLMEHFESEVAKDNGRLILIETSSSSIYRSARKLYESMSYSKTCWIKDFYKPGDDKIIYKKIITKKNKLF